MEIIAQDRVKIPKQYQLAFKLHGANGAEFLDFDLPNPNYLLHTKNGNIILMWCINGYFGTQKNKAYLDDIIARFLISFVDYRPERIKYPLTILEHGHKDLLSRHELKEFQGLKSIRRSKKISEAANQTTTKDQVFWAIKIYAEYVIKDQGTVDYDDLIDFAERNFENKERSTLKAKCRNVAEWYKAREFKIGEKKKNRSTKTKEEIKMTRQERAIKNSTEKANKAKAKVIGAVQSLKFLQQKITVRAVADYANVSKNTAEKYLKEIAV